MVVWTHRGEDRTVGEISAQMDGGSTMNILIRWRLEEENIG